MDKEFLFKILIKALKVGSLVSTGAGAFLLFSPNKERSVEIAKFEDTGVIVKKAGTTTGKWIYEEEYEDSSFLLSCSGERGDDLKKNCYRRLKSKYLEHPINLYLTKPSYSGATGWSYYKFTYSGSEKLEDTEKTYYGECYVGATKDTNKEKEELEDEKNVCNKKNIPDLWTREDTKTW